MTNDTRSYNNHYRSTPNHHNQCFCKSTFWHSASLSLESQAVVACCHWIHRQWLRSARQLILFLSFSCFLKAFFSFLVLASSRHTSSFSCCCTIIFSSRAFFFIPFQFSSFLFPLLCFFSLLNIIFEFFHNFIICYCYCSCVHASLFLLSLLRFW